MIKIFAHRGLHNNCKPNSLAAVVAAKNIKIGCELDLRNDFDKVIISHDAESHDIQELAPVLAINNDCIFDVKVNGLVRLLKSEQVEWENSPYVFANVHPVEIKQYQQNGFKVLNTIYGEINLLKIPSMYGHLVDPSFFDLNLEEILKLASGFSTPIYIISPDVHKKNHIESWNLIKNFNHKYPQKFIGVMTDQSLDAINFFSN